MSNQLTKESAIGAILNRPCVQQLSVVEQVRKDYMERMASPALGSLQKAVVAATAINVVRGALTDEVMNLFLPLMDSPLGFKTDRKQYSTEDVKTCLVQALLVGVLPFGNRFNIISGQCYITQQGYEGLVRGIPGLTDLDYIAGTPTILDGGKTAAIRVVLKWKIDGREMSLVNEKGESGNRLFTVAVNAGMGPDAIIGKAKRKALKAAYELLMGSDLTPADGDLDDMGPAIPIEPAATEKPSRTAGLREKLAARKQPAQEQEQPQAEQQTEPEQPQPEQAAEPGPITDEQRSAIAQQFNRLKLTQADKDEILKGFGVKALSKLSEAQAGRLLIELQDLEGE